MPRARTGRADAGEDGVAVATSDEESAATSDEDTDSDNEDEDEDGADLTVDGDSMSDDGGHGRGDAAERRQRRRTEAAARKRVRLVSSQADQPPRPRVPRRARKVVLDDAPSLPEGPVRTNGASGLIERALSERPRALTRLVRSGGWGTLLAV